MPRAHGSYLGAGLGPRRGASFTSALQVCSLGWLGYLPQADVTEPVGDVPGWWWNKSLAPCGGNVAPVCGLPQAGRRGGVVCRDVTIRRPQAKRRGDSNVQTDIRRCGMGSLGYGPGASLSMTKSIPEVSSPSTTVTFTGATMEGKSPILSPAPGGPMLPLKYNTPVT